MRRNEARNLLGVSSDDPAELRAAFRRCLREAHPDTNDATSAPERTRELIAAYRMLSEAPPEPARPSRGPRTAPGPGPTAGPAPEARPPAPVMAFTVRMLDGCTISIGLPRHDTLDVLVDTADRLGEIVYLDGASGLVEVLVEFVEAPTSSVVMSLQGRANGTTEVFCSVESLSREEAPPADAVTRLVAETLRAVASEG